jgi:hypothetical protein
MAVPATLLLVAADHTPVLSMSRTAHAGTSLFLPWCEKERNPAKVGWLWKTRRGSIRILIHDLDFVDIRFRY